MRQALSRAVRATDPNQLQRQAYLNYYHEKLMQSYEKAVQAQLEMLQVGEDYKLAHDSRKANQLKVIAQQHAQSVIATDSQFRRNAAAKLIERADELTPKQALRFFAEGMKERWDEEGSKHAQIERAVQSTARALAAHDFIAETGIVRNGKFVGTNVSVRWFFVGPEDEKTTELCRNLLAGNGKDGYPYSVMARQFFFFRHVGCRHDFVLNFPDEESQHQVASSPEVHERLAAWAQESGGLSTRKALELVKAWEEVQHPREESGRFARKPGRGINADLIPGDATVTLVGEHGVESSRRWSALRENAHLVLPGAGSAFYVQARNAQWYRLQRPAGSAEFFAEQLAREHVPLIALNHPSALKPAVSEPEESVEGEGWLKEHNLPIERLKGIYEFEHEESGLRSRIAEVEATEFAVSVYGEIYHESNPAQKVGHFERRIMMEDEPYVEHDIFTLLAGHQQAGFASAWYEHCENEYRKSNLYEVRMTANIDVGGYAWARMGFDFAEPKEREGLRNDFLARLRRLKGQEEGVSDAAYHTLSRQIGELHHAWEFAAYPATHAYSKKRLPADFGKSIMLGSQWHAVKYLHESDDGFRVGREYMERKKKKVR